MSGLVSRFPIRLPCAMAIKAAALMASMTLAGCIHTEGRDFNRPEQLGVSLGQTTESDILSRYGAPSSRDSATYPVSFDPTKQPSPFDRAPVPGVFTHLRYRYSQRQPPIYGGDISQKGALFTFWNGVLIGHDFNSSFAADSSNFDEATAQVLLAPRQMTRDQIIASFGNPGGRLIYPLTPAPGMERLIYSYQKVDANSRQRQTKIMDIVVDASGQMLDYRAISAVDPFAPPAPPSSSVGFIYVPKVHVGGGRR